MGRLGCLEDVRRVGHPPAGAVGGGEEPVGVGGGREVAALERGGPEREDPLLAERRADLAHQVEVARRARKPPNTSSPRTEPSASIDVDLEGGAAVAGDP